MNLAEKYRIVKPLSEQRKFAQVFLGELKEDGSPVVIKVLKKNQNNRHIAQRLVEEATFNFNVPGLPEIQGIYDTPTEVLLVKKYYPGIALSAYIRQFRNKEKLDVLVQVLTKLIPILDYIHEEGILHLDIKPGNILVSSNQDVALIDFGMALRKENFANRSTLFPLGFAAPELLLNKLNLVDQRTDYFALAVTCWTCLQDKMPLMHPNPSITTNLQLTHPLPDLDKPFQAMQEPLQQLGAKHFFKIPPNKLDAQELELALRNGMEKRFPNLQQFMQAIDENLSVQKKWWKLL